MSNDSITKTLLVAAALCIVCSILVSSAAVGLKSTQEFNKQLDTKKNILMAAGLLKADTDIETAFKKIDVKTVDIATGEFVTGDQFNNFDQKKAAKDPQLSVLIPKKLDLGKIKRRSKFAPVYFVKSGEEIETIILPIHGKGLWSTMYAFLALEGNTNVVKGLSFYDHGETPGLGGEVDNPFWKKQWIGKKIFNPDWSLAINILKGKVNPKKPEAIHQIDGLSGATLTAVGVNGLIRYWLGENGFDPLLKKIRKQGEENG